MSAFGDYGLRTPGAAAMLVYGRGRPGEGRVAGSCRPVTGHPHGRSGQHDAGRGRARSEHPWTIVEMKAASARAGVGNARTEAWHGLYWLGRDVDSGHRTACCNFAVALGTRAAESGKGSDLV